MAIIRLPFSWIKDQYISIFPDIDFRPGGDNYQTIEFLSMIAERNLENILEASSKMNLYFLVGDDLVVALTKLGYSRSEGFKARIRISIAGDPNDFIGEPFSITQDTIVYTATCVAQESSGSLILLDLETDDPALLVFIDQLEVQYTGTLTVNDLQKIALLFGGRLREGEIAYRERVLALAPTPNRFKFNTLYENMYYDPSPEISYLPNGEYNLFFPKAGVEISKLLFIYVSLNNITPTRSLQTETFIEEQLQLTDDVSVTFGYNVYGEVNLQILVYLKAGATEDDKAKITEILKTYSYTPTVDTPIYSDDIIRNLQSLGISSISNITFLYNGLTNLQLSFQDKQVFKLDTITPIIFQTGDN